MIQQYLESTVHHRRRKENSFVCHFRQFLTSDDLNVCYLMRVPSLAGCQFWGSPHLLDVSFEGPLNCWMSVLRVPSLAGCQFLEGPLTCLDVMWSLFWSKLDLKMKIWPTSGRFGENCLLKLVLVCLILTQWWNKKKWLYFPFNTGMPRSKSEINLSSTFILFYGIFGLF